MYEVTARSGSAFRALDADTLREANDTARGMFGHGWTTITVSKVTGAGRATTARRIVAMWERKGGQMVPMSL